MSSSAESDILLHNIQYHLASGGQRFPQLPDMHYWGPRDKPIKRRQLDPGEPSAAKIQSWVKEDNTNDSNDSMTIMFEPIPHEL